MRYALYARYSSDLSKPTSIEDQLRLCRELVARRGGVIAATFTDAELSGFAMINRPGVRALMAAAETGAFDIVLSEGLDRLSRGQSETSLIYELLTYRDIVLETLDQGVIDELKAGFSGMKNAIYLKDLAGKIRRGQRGTVERGRFPGGLAYGYHVDDTRRDTNGDRIPGYRVIDEDQANVVRRIFARYAAGESARTIAQTLNRDGTPSPFGGAWSAAAITGNVARGNGILHTELYLGRLVYNRTTFRKNPATGRRVSRINPREQWVIHEMPELRIVSDELWHAAHAVMDGYRTNAGGAVRRRPKHLFAGLVVCGVCGGTYARRDTDKLGCSNHKDRGTCGNRKIMRISALEAKILDAMRDKLLAPDIVAEAVQTYHEARQRTRRDAARKAAGNAGQLKEIKGKIGRLVQAIEDGIAPPDIKARLAELGRVREDLEAELQAAAGDDTVIDLHPRFVARYQQRIADLAAALAKDETTRSEAMMVIRGMVRQITLTPAADGTLAIDLDAELEGLARVVRGEAPRPGVKSMVAEERYRRNDTPALRVRC